MTDLPTRSTELSSEWRRSIAPTYSYIYWSEIDKAAHEYGTSHSATIDEVVKFDREMERLFQSLKSGSRLVVTADHGHLDYTEQSKILVRDQDRLRDFFTAEPSGDERSFMFHVRQGVEQEFSKEFLDRFGDHFLLLTTAEVLESGLLGPHGVSELTFSRLGSFTAIANSNAGMKFLTPENQRKIRPVGQHGGLSSEEMLVPLIIA